MGAIPQLDPEEQPNKLETKTSTVPNPVQPTSPPADLDPALQTLLQTITSESTSLDQIVSKSGMETGQVSAGLLQLELLGLVSQQPGMRYRRT